MTPSERESPSGPSGWCRRRGRPVRSETTVNVACPEGIRVQEGCRDAEDSARTGHPPRGPRPRLGWPAGTVRTPEQPCLGLDWDIPVPRHMAPENLAACAI